MTTRIWGKLTDDGTGYMAYGAYIYIDYNLYRSRKYFSTKSGAKRYLRKQVKKIAKELQKPAPEVYTYTINIPDKPQSRWQRWLNS